ncbi:MAG: SIS domain-containing protein [Candidatus Diapherotrites archaeon]|nr:SIS domain-containing protein [Candidatus Diapherotrites archaeon]
MPNYEKTLIENFEENKTMMEKYPEILKTAEKTAEKIVECIQNGRNLLICGNGGSAADANHFEAELINKYKKDRKPLAAISLSSNISNLTAIANDYSFDFIFSRQIKSFGKKGDVLVAFSTSGKSKNILEALKTAREQGICTILFTGNQPAAEAVQFSDIVLKVPSNNTPRIQEMHAVLYHALSEIVESECCEE